MNWIIRQIATLIANRIQRGSPAVTLSGAIAGMFIGIALAYFLDYHELLDRSWIAAAITLGIVGGLSGALIGSVPTRGDAIAVAPPHAVSPFETVRATRLNQGLVPLFFFFVAIGVCALIVFENHIKRRPLFGEPWQVAIGVAVVFAIGVVSARMPLWVSFGSEIVVRRLLSVQRYSRSQIKYWGFHISPGTLVTRPVTHAVQLVITFDDGFHFETIVQPRKSAEISRVMGA